jgi:hypothetical protein
MLELQSKIEETFPNVVVTTNPLNQTVALGSEEDLDNVKVYLSRLNIKSRYSFIPQKILIIK